jgi:hypothetical protein
MLGVIAAACVVLSTCERIPGSDGLGFLTDGVTYGAIVKDPAMALSDRYYVHRALPSWIVHAGLRLGGLPLTNPHIIQGFVVLNSILLIAATALWRPIGDRLQLNLGARWVGFLALFGNFALLKMPFYYPVVTDTAAFALGLLAVYASLERRRILLGLATLAATFAWPIGSILAAPLLLWPTGRVRPPNAGQRTILPLFAACTAAGLFVAWFVWIYVVRGQTVRASHFAVPVVPGIVWAGVLGASAYIVYSVRGVLAGVTGAYVVAALRRIDLVGAALWLGALLPSTVVAMLFGENRPQMGMRQFIGNVVLFSSSRPLLFGVSAVAYFGPLLLVFIDREVRARAVQVVRDLGPGWMILAVATLGLSVNSESRQNIFQFPAVIAVLGAAMTSVALTARSVWLLAAIAVVGSKVWLSINLEPARMVDTNDPLMTWYYRRYTMNLGAWMSNYQYVVQAFATVIAGGAIWWILRSSRRATGVASGASVTSAASDDRS